MIIIGIFNIGILSFEVPHFKVLWIDILVFELLGLLTTIIYILCLYFSSKYYSYYTFKKILNILGSDFNFENKDTARNFFNQLRQKFIDWNYSPWDADKFKAAEKDIDAHYASSNAKVRNDVAVMLKDGE